MTAAGLPIIGYQSNLRLGRTNKEEGKKSGKKKACHDWLGV